MKAILSCSPSKKYQLTEFRLAVISPKACKKVNPCRWTALHTFSCLSPSSCSPLQYLLAEFPLYLSAAPYLLKAAFYLFLFPPLLSSLISPSLLRSLPPHLLSPSWICFTLHCSRPSEDPGWMSHPLTICCPKALQASATSKDPTAVHGHAWTYIYARSHAHFHIAKPFFWGNKCRKCL